MRAAVMTAFRRRVSKPERLLERKIDVGGVNEVLGRMSAYKTSGFNIITSWAVSPATVGSGGQFRVNATSPRLHCVLSACHLAAPVAALGARRCARN